MVKIGMQFLVVGDMSGSFLKGFSTHAAANWAGCRGPAPGMCRWRAHYYGKSHHRFFDLHQRRLHLVREYEDLALERSRMG